MKVQRQQLLNDLLPQLSVIGDMQKRGSLALPQKVGYAIGKAFSQCNQLQKSFEKFKTSQLELFVEKNEKGSGYQVEPTKQMNQGQQVFDWKYKSAEDKQKFTDAINDWAQEEIDWNPLKVSQDDMKQVHNMPVDILSMLEEFGITTELSLSTAAPMGIVN